MDSTGIRNNMSSHQLIRSEDFDRLSRMASHPDGSTPGISGNSSISSSQSKLDGKEISSSGTSTSDEPQQLSTTRKMTKRQIATVIILCFINLINYMDRMTIAGILIDIQCEFQIDDVGGGLIQTAFIASYMVCAPIFGYLGDRYSRRYLMAAGIFIWSLTTLLGSFATTFPVFIALRALVGVGEASYSTIAPTIISDITVGDMRSKMLALFYFAIPVGSGLGYIVGSETAKALGSWHWGLRVTPVAGALAVLLVLLVAEDPERGESEGSHLTPTSWWDDIKSLAKNKSFIMSSIAATAVAFVAGALAWWGPKFIALGLTTQEGQQDKVEDVSYIFGLIAMLAGLMGVPLGSVLGQKLRVRFPRADPLVCGAGMILSVPFMLGGLYLAKSDTTACFAVVFFGQLLLNLNWSIVADMCLYVVIPTRRATAEALQILLSHALGDAGSPYLIGQVSELLKNVLTPKAVLQTWNNGTDSSLLLAEPTSSPVPFDCNGTSINPDTAEVDFKALQYSLLITVVVEVIGGFFFLATAWWIVEDKAKVDRAVADGSLTMKELAVKLTWNHVKPSYNLGLDSDDTRTLTPAHHKRPYSGQSTPEEEEPISITPATILPIV